MGQLDKGCMYTRVSQPGGLGPPEGSRALKKGVAKANVRIKINFFSIQAKSQNNHLNQGKD